MAGFNPKLENQNHREKRYGHLAPGAKPIIVSMNDWNYRNSGPHQLETQNIISDIIIGGQRIDDHASFSERDQANMEYTDKYAFIISDCNENDKFSEGYHRCMGLLAMGENEKTGRQISLLSHADPYFTLPGKDEAEHFMLALHAQLKKMREQCKKGTIDAVMFGGKADYPLWYRTLMDHMGDICKNELAFKPTMLTGPNDTPYPVNIYVKTQEREVYFVRAEQADSALDHPYDIDDYNDHKDGWVNKKV